MGDIVRTRTLTILCCGSARFRRLFPEYCEEHAQRLTSQVQAPVAVTLQWYTWGGTEVYALHCAAGL